MPESLLVRRIMKEYRARGAFCEKMHGNDFVRAGLPDLIACYKGFFIAIECKVPGNYPTEVQLQCRREIHKAHGISLVTYTLEEATAVLDSIDDSAFYGSYACLVCGGYMKVEDEDPRTLYCEKGHMTRNGDNTTIVGENKDALQVRSKNARGSKAKPGKVSATARGKLLAFPSKGVSGS